MSEELRCIHRHTEKTHPNCFKNGLIKQDWWAGKRIGFLDIETTDLKADIGFMLSWCIKPLDEKKILFDMIDKKDMFNGVFDRGLTESLVDAMKSFDIIGTYYGTGFDIPFIRSRADYHRIDFPEFGSIYHWDLYFRVRSKYKLHRCSLAAITAFLDIPGKTPLDISVWFKAKYGDREALKNILEHNRQDVLILESLYKRIGKYSKWNRSSI